MSMIAKFKPQKGKALDKLPKKTLAILDNTEYIVSTKFDGNQIFIVKEGSSIRFFTSDWKEFELELVADEFKDCSHNFVLIGEFMHGCAGKLGDRVNSAILTTYRTNFAKGKANIGLGQIGTNIQVFDCLTIYNGELMTQVPYKLRLQHANNIIRGRKYLTKILYETMLGKDIPAYTQKLVSKGWEGTMAVETNSYYHVGKRVNHSIKFKYRPTADLLCQGIVPGEGKYDGMIGALILMDSKSRIVCVGSGLSDELRGYHEDYFIGEVIEIEYEQIIDTYIQPTFVAIRRDKYKSEID